MTDENKLLVLATKTAITERRKELNDRLGELSYNTILKEWKTVSSTTKHEIEEIAQIKNELSIIDSLMIRTQKLYQKYGGKIEIQIRRSDKPNQIERSFQA